MKIDRPIFIVGSGRSGTEILNDLVSLHPDLCWISNISLRMPYIPCAPAVQRVLDWGKFGQGLKRRILAREKGILHVSPVEPDAAYDAIGFRNDVRLTEEDYSAELDARFRKLISRHLYWTNKPRFISKQTANTQRYRLLNRLFPDALFIHLVRDGRAVVNSMLQQNWMDTLALWWTGDKAINNLDNYDDPVQLFGMHWLKNLAELQGSKGLLQDRYLELRYEDLAEDVHGSIEKIRRFAGLQRYEDYESILPATLTNMNYKWESDLSEMQKSLLEDVIGDKLREFGYLGY